MSCLRVHSSVMSRRFQVPLQYLRVEHENQFTSGRYLRYPSFKIADHFMWSKFVSAKFFHSSCRSIAGRFPILPSNMREKNTAKPVDITRNYPDESKAFVVFRWMLAQLQRHCELHQHPADTNAAGFVIFRRFAEAHQSPSTVFFVKTNSLEAGWGPTAWLLKTESGRNGL